MRKAVGSILLGIALAAGPAAARAEAVSYTSVNGRSRIALHVLKKGLFSGMAHDHHFVPEDWSARASLDDASQALHVDVVIAAASLRDEQPQLSPDDRDKVNKQAVGSAVLDAARYPEIRFTADKLERRSADGGAPEGDLDGVLVGKLSLHGRERPLSVPVHATIDRGAWHARGVVGFKQSDFGIHPYSGFLGTVAVHDEVKLEYDLVLARRR